MSDIDLHAVSRCYGHMFTGCALVVPGANRTYRLTANDAAYYLRLYRPTGRSAAEIAFEMCLLNEVRPTPGIDVARPIPTTDGTDCARVLFEGVDRVGGLLHALDGRPLANDPEDVALFGSALARLHGALSGIEAGGARPLDPATLCAHPAAPRDRPLPTPCGHSAYRTRLHGKHVFADRVTAHPAARQPSKGKICDKPCRIDVMYENRV